MQKICSTKNENDIYSLSSCLKMFSFAEHKHPFHIAKMDVDFMIKNNKTCTNNYTMCCNPRFVKPFQTDQQLN